MVTKLSWGIILSCLPLFTAMYVRPWLVPDVSMDVWFYGWLFALSWIPVTLCVHLLCARPRKG
jgi:hypothetical protein